MRKLNRKKNEKDERKQTEYGIQKENIDIKIKKL